MGAAPLTEASLESSTIGFYGDIPNTISKRQCETQHRCGRSLTLPVHGTVCGTQLLLPNLNLRSMFMQAIKVNLSGFFSTRCYSKYILSGHLTLQFHIHGVEKDHSAHRVLTAPCRVANQQTRLPRATSSLALNASNPSLGSHCSTFSFAAEPFPSATFPNT